LVKSTENFENKKSTGSLRECACAIAVHKGKLFSTHEGGAIKVYECEGLPLSAMHGDPEAHTLSVKELRARVSTIRAYSLSLPNDKMGYTEKDIKKLKSKASNSPLVRLYNTYVRATRDLSDAERAAPFCHNITFPTGEED
jgi:hypothetical protein